MLERCRRIRVTLFSSLPVYKVFENVAHHYDTMNDAMSLGIHRLWKDALLHAMHPQPGAQLLDVAGGTGRWSRLAKNAKLQKVAFNESFFLCL